MTGRDFLKEGRHAGLPLRINIQYRKVARFNLFMIDFVLYAIEKRYNYFYEHLYGMVTK
jgi:hypothetical protein